MTDRAILYDILRHVIGLANRNGMTGLEMLEQYRDLFDTRIFDGVPLVHFDLDEILVRHLHHDFDAKAVVDELISIVPTDD